MPEGVGTTPGLRLWCPYGWRSRSSGTEVLCVRASRGLAGLGWAGLGTPGHLRGRGTSSAVFRWHPSSSGSRRVPQSRCCPWPWPACRQAAFHMCSRVSRLVCSAEGAGPWSQLLCLSQMIFLCKETKPGYLMDCVIFTDSLELQMQGKKFYAWTLKLWVEFKSSFKCLLLIFLNFILCVHVCVCTTLHEVYISANFIIKQAIVNCPKIK